MEELQFTIDPVPPFRLDLTAWILRRRPANRIDSWDGKTFSRVINIDAQPVLVSVEQTGRQDFPQLEVTLSSEAIPKGAGELATAALNRLLGLRIDLSPFYALASKDPYLGPLAARFTGAKPPRYLNLFEAVANGIIGQQLSLYAAINILNRFTEAWGRPIIHSGIFRYSFPEADDLCGAAPEKIKEAGLTANKAKAVAEAARIIHFGELELTEIENLENSYALERLVRLRGIGAWTADYVLLRGLGRLDVFPRNDSGALKSLGKWLKDDQNISLPPSDYVFSKWSPYAGLVYFHLLLNGLFREGLIV